MAIEECTTSKIEATAVAGGLSFMVGCAAMFCILKTCDHMKSSKNAELQIRQQYQGQELQETTMDDSFEEREARFGSSMKKLARFVSPVETDRNL